MRFAEIIDDVLAGRTYIREDSGGDLRECYYRKRYDRIAFAYSDPDIVSWDHDRCGAHLYAPTPEDLTADDWEPEPEEGDP